MKSEGKHYDAFIAYSKKDLGDKCSKAIYSWLSKYPLEVFLDDTSSGNTIGTTQELLQSDSIILILTKDTLERLEEELKVECQTNKNKSGLIEELDAINIQIEKEIAEQKKKEEKPDIEHTDTCKKLTAINIIVGKDPKGKDIRFRKRDFADRYPEVFKRYIFLRYLKYKLVYYTDDDNFIIDKEQIECSLNSKTQIIIERHRQKAIRRKHILLFSVIAAFAIIISLVVISQVISCKNNTISEQQKTINNYNEPIVFIGGSTTKNVVLNEYTPDTSDNIAFVHIPTQTAWELLKETYKDTDKRINQFSIILSSQEIKIDKILKADEQDTMKNDDFRILDMELDSVPLQVVIYPRNHEIIDGKKRTLHLSELRELIYDHNAILATTSKESGTLAKYRKILGDTLLLGQIIIDKRYNTLKNYSKPNIFVISLQNTAYGFDTTGNVSTYQIVDSNNHTIKMPTHLYTLVKFKTDNDGIYVLDEKYNRIKEMLIKLGWDEKYNNSDEQLSKSCCLIVRLSKNQKK